MPIKTSGEISFQDIIDEFGRPAGGAVYLDAYRRGGSLVPDKNVNSNIPLAGTTDPISLSDFYGATRIITMTFKIYGGGGAGGSGYENNGSSTTRGGTGGNSVIMKKSDFDSYISSNGGVVPKNVIAGLGIPTTTGGLLHSGGIFRAANYGSIGGESGKNTDANATAGEASDFGDGGAAGARNNAGSNPAWGNWAAGGGGGGGDQGKGDNYFIVFNEGGGDEWGAAGTGGEASGAKTGTADIDVETDYIVAVGHGGYPATNVGNHDGGYGAPGYIEFELDMSPGVVYTFEPGFIANPVNADYYKTHYWLFRLERDGTVIARFLYTA